MSFARKKAAILARLAVPAAEYADASPKGSVDDAIRGLIADVNARPGLVTTSSCAGRVCVFVEGRKGPQEKEQGQEKDQSKKLASRAGGKGGGSWLLVSHDPISADEDVTGMFGLEPGDEDEPDDEPPRLIHFKFEPMILHILAASPADAEAVLQCGLQAGYRESGTVNVTGSPIVAIRSAGLTFESLVGVEHRGRRRALVSPSYLRMLVAIANERFDENSKRIERFQSALRAEGRERKETKEARREAKRAEGLRRQTELREREAEADEIKGGIEGIEGIEDETIDVDEQ